MVHTVVRSHRGWSALVLLCLLVSIIGCGGQPAPQPAAATATLPAVRPTATPAAPPAPAPIPDGLLTLPEAFRYEVILRPAESATTPATFITGSYRRGAWAQSARTGEGLAEESVVIAETTYTRPAGAPAWTQWPGISFDAAYGLASPFAILRLYPLAGEQARGVLAPVAGAPVATFRQPAALSAAVIQRLLSAGIAASAADAAGRAALEAQIAPLAVSQTITYWAGEEGRIYRATATLLAADAAGQPAPWLEATWRFWAYDDPAIAIAPPAEAHEAAGPVPAGQPAPADTAAPSAPAAAANLTVRVFASPGVPAQDAAVTVYPADARSRPLDSRSAAEARFALPPGRYDVLAQLDYAEEWLRGIEVAAGMGVTRDVIFDFGTLKLTVTQASRPIPAEIITYPAGDRQAWVDWRTDNPATLRLRAGVYDVEIAYNDYKSKQTVTGLAVRAGEAVERVVEVNP